MSKSAITQAVIRRDYCHLHKLLEKANEQTLNAVDDDGFSALHHAARKGFCVSTLLKSNIDLDIRDHAGNTALMLACCEGLCGVVKALCEGGANPNISNNFNKAPLQVLCIKGHVECVDELVQCGADISAVATEDIIQALEYGRTGTVIYMLKLISDYRRFSTSIKNIEHPFIAALRLENEECVDAMLEMGCVKGGKDLRRLLDKEAGPKLTEELLALLQDCCESPLSLKVLSRLAIRRNIDQPVTLAKCRQLPLPNGLKGYVAMDGLVAASSRKRSIYMNDFEH